MITVPVIIGNLCAFLAMGVNAFSATRKTTKSMLRAQNISQLVYCASAIVLRGYSAAVQNIVSIFRNTAAIRNVKSRLLEWLLVILGVALGVVFNNRGLLGLLPVVGNLQYTLAIFCLKGNERVVKVSFLLSVAAFVVFNIMLYNFVGAASDMVVIVTTVIALFRTGKRK